MRVCTTRLKINHAFGVCITYTEPLFIILYYYYKYQYQIPMIINIFISTRVLCAVLVVTFNRMRERFPLNTWWIRQQAQALKCSKRLRSRRTLLYAFVACAILSNIKSNPSQTSSRQGNRLPPRIAIVCYGLPRSLRWTLRSIETNVRAPLSRHFRIDVALHSYIHNETYSNPRTLEDNIQLDNDEWKALRPDIFKLESVATVKTQQEETLRAIADFGDPWKDNLKSLSNILLALHSLEQATLLVLASNQKYDGALILRPDLYYLDPIDVVSFRDAIQQSSTRATLMFPCWQSWWGVNDRFMYGDFEYIMAIGRRIRAVKTYCETTHSALHSEKFLKWFISNIDARESPNRSLALMCTNQRAIRIRSNGATRRELFTSDFKP